jgi:hypothetical protein
MERLAAIECSPHRLRDAIQRAALDSDEGEPHEKMFVRVTPDRIETPASSPGATQAAYCTVDTEWFDRLTVTAEGAVEALFDVAALVGWLDWFEGDQVTVTFEGDGGHATRLVVDDGEATVEVGCEDDPAVLSSVETFLPRRFEGSTFLDDAGNQLPTRVETTAATLSRFVDAVDRATGAERYPLVVRRGRLQLDVIGERGTVESTLPGDVAGPAITNHYGPGFARVVSGLEGEVTLQTGPAESVAFVQDGDWFTARFVVAHV